MYTGEPATWCHASVPSVFAWVFISRPQEWEIKGCLKNYTSMAESLRGPKAGGPVWDDEGMDLKKQRGKLLPLLLGAKHFS